MVELKEVVGSVLLPLQLSLGIFQIMKTTPLWAVIHCTLAYFLHCFYFPYTDYKQLQGFQGRVFKKVISHATTAGNVSKVKKQKQPEKCKKEGKSENDGPVSVVYLGEKFVLERMEGNKMQVKFELERKEGEKLMHGPAYYITDKMWETVKYIEKVASKTVFVKDHKEIWEEVITGDIMKFEEVLDSVILDNREVIGLDHDYFLPVNLLMSEDKLMKTLNFVGLFLKTQNHIHWLIPASLTFTSAIMGFSTIVRLCIDGFINTILCRSVQLLFDLLPLATRRWAYSWGNWVENLKPSNDLKSKIVSGSIFTLVAGGAKVHSEFLADCESLDGRVRIRVLVGEGAKAHLETSSDYESLVDLGIKVDRGNIRALVAGGTKALEHSVDIESLNNPPVDEIWPKVGPFLFKCESKCDLKCNSKRFSIYVEWIFDNTTQICSLKVGRVASQESLKSHEIYIVPVVDNCRRENDIKPRFACSCGKEEHYKSLIADDFDTTSVDVECSSEEAIKLFIFAFYMAKHRSGSLKSYNRKTNKVCVRRFIESINAYVRSSYPPLYRLIMDDVVVR